MKRINYLPIAIAIYVVAIIAYAFYTQQSIGWMLYRDYVFFGLVIILFWFAFKRKKTELEKSLVVGIVFQRLFSLICFQYWYSTGADWWDTPIYFSTIVVCCMFVRIACIYVKRKLSWK